MKQIEKNPMIALAGDWFTAVGKGINLGWFGKTENQELAEKLRRVFAEWIDNGTIILRMKIQLFFVFDWSREFCFLMEQGMR